MERHVWASSLLILVSVFQIGSTQTCSPYGFHCIDATTYNLCEGDNQMLGGPTKCQSGFCQKECKLECSTNICSTCNSNGYHCLDTKTYLECVAGNPKPGPVSQVCGGPTYCSKNCNAKTICTTEMCPVTCTEDSKVANPDDPKAYYACSVDSDGSVTVTSQTCPAGTIFNQTMCRTEVTTTTTTTTTTTPSTTTSATTTTPKPFTCSAAGRFPDPANCTKYYLCITQGSVQVAYSYNCPAGSYYHAAATRCESNSSVCTLQAFMLVAPQLAPLAEGVECTEGDVKMADADSCGHYYICGYSEDGEPTPYRYECPTGTGFNPHSGRCSTQHVCFREFY